MSQKDELHSSLSRKVNDMRNKIATLENKFGANYTQIKMTQESMGRQQRQDHQLVQILDDKINGYQQKYDELDAAIVGLQMSPVSVGPSHLEIDALETQFKSLEGAVINIQQVLTETIERIEMSDSLPSVNHQSPPYHDEGLIVQLERLEQSVEYLETARRSIDARLAGIDTDTIKNKSEMSGLRLRLTKMADEIRGVNDDLVDVRQLSQQQYGTLTSINVRLNQTEADINQIKISQSATTPQLELIADQVNGLIEKKDQVVRKSEFNTFKNSVEELYNGQMSSTEHNFNSIKNQMSNITLSLAKTSQLSSRNELHLSELDREIDLSSGKDIILSSQPEFINLQTKIATFESDLVNYQVQSINRDETMGQVVEHVESLERDLKGYKQLLAAYQAAVVTKPQVEKAIELQTSQNEQFSNDLNDIKSKFTSLPDQMRRMIGKQLRELSQQIEKAEKSLDQVNERLSSQTEQVGQLEADFVNFEFVIDDEIMPQMLMLNESLVTIEEEIENTIPTSVHRIEHLLMDEIENKFKKINDNMQKFSDVSSLSANELRSLFESQLLQIHSQLSNQDAKQQAQMSKQTAFNEKTTSYITSLEEKTKLHETTIGDMSSIVTQQTMSIEGKVDKFKKELVQYQQKLVEQEKMYRSARRDYNKLDEKVDHLQSSNQESIGELKTNIENAKGTMKSAVELNREIYGHVNEKISLLTVKNDELIHNLTLINEKHRDLRDNSAERFKHHQHLHDQLAKSSGDFVDQVRGLKSSMKSSLESISTKVTINTANIKKDRKINLNTTSQVSALGEYANELETRMISGLEAMTSKDKLTAVMKLFDAKLESDKAALRDLELEIESDMKALRSNIERTGKQIQNVNEKNRQLETHFNQAMAFEKQNSIKQINIVEGRLSDPIRGLQRKLDSFEQLVMSELNNNDENDAELNQKIKSLNTTLISDGKQLADVKNTINTVKRTATNTRKKLEDDIEALMYQAQMHEEVLQNLEGIDKTSVSDSMEKHSKLADTVIQLEENVKANGIRVDQVSNKLTNELHTVNNDINKLDDHDRLVHVQLESLATKLVDVERSSNNQADILENTETKLDKVRDTLAIKSQKINELEPKINRNHRQLENFKKQTNSTLSKMQSSLDGVTEQLYAVKQDSDQDVDALVDGFDFLIESLGANLERKRRSTGPSKLISKIQQLAEAFRKMRHKVSENNAEFERVYTHFQQINDKFVENESNVRHIKGRVGSNHQQILDALDMVEKLSTTQLDQELAMSSIQESLDEDKQKLDQINTNDREIKKLVSELEKVSKQLETETKRIDTSAEEMLSTVVENNQNTEMEFMLLDKSIKYLNETVTRRQSTSMSQISQFDKRLSTVENDFGNQLDTAITELERAQSKSNEKVNQLSLRFDTKLGGVEFVLNDLSAITTENKELGETVKLSTMANKKLLVDQNATLSEIQADQSSFSDKMLAFEQANLMLNDDVEKIQVAVTSIENDLARHVTNVKTLETTVNRLAEADDKVLTSDFLADIEKLRNLIKISNNTVESTITQLQKDLAQLQQDQNEVDERMRKDFELLSKRARERMQKDSKGLELEFTVFQNDMKNKLAAFDKRLETANQKTTVATNSIETLVHEQSALKTKDLGLTERTRKMEIKSAQFQSKLDTHQKALVDYESRIQSNKNYSKTVAKTFGADLRENIELIESVKLQVNKNALQLSETTQKTSRIETRFDSYINQNANHLHGKIESQINALHKTDVELMSKIADIKNKLNIEQQEFERIQTLEKIFKDSVLLKVKQMNSSIQHNQHTQDDRVSKIKNKLQNQIHSIDELTNDLSTKLTKLATTENVQTEMDKVSNKIELTALDLIDKLSNSNTQLQAEVESVESELEKRLASITSRARDLEKNSEKLTSEQAGLEKKIRLLQIEDSGLKNEFSHFSIDISRRLKSDQESLVDHEEALKQAKLQINLLSSNLDFIRSLVPTNLPDQLLTLTSNDHSGKESMMRLNETLTDLTNKITDQASKSHLAEVKQKSLQLELLLDELRNSMNGLSLNVNDELVNLSGNFSGVVEQRHRDLLERVESRELELARELKQKTDEINQYKIDIQNTRQLVNQLAGELSNVRSTVTEKLDQHESRHTDGNKRVDKFDEKLDSLRIDLLSVIANTDDKFGDYVKIDDFLTVKERLDIIDDDTKKIEDELVNLEKLKNKVRHNEEISRQQFELLKSNLDKQTESFTAQLGQHDQDRSDIKDNLQKDITVLSDRLADIGVRLVDLQLLQNGVESLDIDLDKLTTRVDEVESGEAVNEKITTLQNKLTDLAKELAQTSKSLSEKDAITEELFSDLTNLSEKGTTNQHLIDKMEQRMSSKEEVIQYLTSQNSVLANKVSNNQQQISRVKHMFNTTVNNILNKSDDEKIPDNLMLRLQTTYATKTELQEAVDQQADHQTRYVQLMSDLADKSEAELKSMSTKLSKYGGKVGDIDSKVETNRMELENFLVDKELMQKSIVRTNQMANANHNQILLISSEMEKLDSALEDTKVR